VEPGKKQRKKTNIGKARGTANHWHSSRNT